jgi:phospholipase D1/2
MAASAGGESPAKPKPLLHGDLDLWIIEARLLPNMDLFSEQVRRCFAACRPPTSCGPKHPPATRGAAGRHHHRKIITSDPYVTLSVSGAVVARTAVIPNNQDPVWDERFAVPLAHRAAALEFQVKDNDTFGAQLIGTVTVPADVVATGEEVEDWYPVIGTNGKPYKPDTALHLRFRFLPVPANPAYRHGIPGDPERRGIKDSYFPLRHGGRLTLYQDAHVREGDLPEIQLDDGKVFEHNSCWEDICHAILEAHHMIYIVGWSVYDKVRLVREPSKSRPLPEGGDLTLGDLLKFKSQEGVRVCLLVWDDKTSHDKFFIKTVRFRCLAFDMPLHPVYVMLTHWQGICVCDVDSLASNWVCFSESIHTLGQVERMLITNNCFLRMYKTLCSIRGHSASIHSPLAIYHKL